MHPILTVSLDCLFLIASLVFSNVCCKSIRLNRKRFPTMQFLWRHEWSSGSGNFSRDFNLYLHNTTLCIKMFLSFKMNNNILYHACAIVIMPRMCNRSIRFYG
jgi:hypothetical protein